MAKKKTLKVYGVDVPREKVETVKKLVAILEQETYTNIHLKDARRRAVIVAIQALIEMAPEASWYLGYF